MNETLLAIESGIFVAGSICLFRRERIFGIYFFALYIYAIFAQVGYLYVPLLSAQIFAYFGGGIWREVTLFIICSGLTLFFFLRYVAAHVHHAMEPWMARLFVEDSLEAPFRSFALSLLAGSLLIETLLFVYRFSEISWDSAQQDDLFSADPALGVFVLLVKLSVGLNLAMYCHLRQQQSTKRSVPTAALAVCSFLLFLLFTLKLGNRTDTLALALGCVVFELSQVRIRLRHLALTILAGVCVLIYLNFVEANRYSTSPTDSDFVTRLLVKDYYAPAHVLFAAVAFDVVDPLRVGESDSGNALMFLKQPYLQADIMEEFFPGGATRNASYGFYALTEGYMFAGFAGFLYNGVVLGLLLSIWRGLAHTRSTRLNLFLLAILGSMLINLVRGQASYYIKYLYTYVLPAMCVYLGISGQRLRWRRPTCGVA